MRQLLILLMMLSLSAFAKCKDKPIVIAVVDTGFGFNGVGAEAHLCKYGHKDFTADQRYYKVPSSVDPVPADFNGHGTNIIGTIEQYAQAAHINYCILVLKYYQRGSGNLNLANTIMSFMFAGDIQADYVNYSGGGKEPSVEERIAVERYLDQGGHMTVAAGNDGVNLDNPANTYYPAEYDKRIVVVGSSDNSGKHLPSSNYGSMINRWELGLHVKAYGITMTGTSQATAVATGKQVSLNTNKCEDK